VPLDADGACSDGVGRWDQVKMLSTGLMMSVLHRQMAVSVGLASPECTNVGD